MRPDSAILISLAAQAGVRPTVIYHAWAFKKVLGENFTPDAYASFTGLPITHVKRVTDILANIEKPKPRKSRQSAAKHVLAADWIMPDEWVLIARERRFWPLDVCRTEADRFTDWHRMKGNAFADWKAAWRNWIDGSRRENGTATADRDEAWTPERRKAYAEGLK